MSNFKIGDIVKVSAEATGFGEDLEGIVRKVETILGNILVNVDWINPSPDYGIGICVVDCHVTKIE